ncbi:MAG: RNA polymerase sigma factor [Deltaproteobacteria bacterium]|nr:RNA polymerase sigma factor [Deltaproteobacteria bacterium]
MSTPRPKPQLAAPVQVDIDACRRGDRRALDALFRAEAPALERLITRQLGPVPEVEDLLQSTLLAAIDAFPRYRGEASVRTWLARIAIHLVCGHLRRPQRRLRPKLELVRAVEAEGSGPPGPERIAAGRQLVERLYRHLDTIGAKKRIAFILHVLEGRPIREVAALVGATQTATKSRVFFARRELLGRVRKDPEMGELLRPDEPEAGP